MFKYLQRVMSGATEESSKRFIGVVCMLLFGFLFLELIVLLPFVLFRVVPASQQTINLYFAMFDKHVYYSFLIICFSIGAIALVNITGSITDVLSGKAMASIIAAQKGTPDTVVKNENVQQQNVGAAGKKQETE